MVYLKGSATKLETFADISQNGFCPLPKHYIVIRNPQQMVQMEFCDLSHTFYKQVPNVSQHVFAILLWGILTSPLTSDVWAQIRGNWVRLGHGMREKVSPYMGVFLEGLHLYG